MAHFVVAVILKVSLLAQAYLSFQGLAIRQKIRKLLTEQRVRELVFLARRGPVQKEEVELYVLKR